MQEQGVSPKGNQEQDEGLECGHGEEVRDAIKENYVNTPRNKFALNKGNKQKGAFKLNGVCKKEVKSRWGHWSHVTFQKIIRHIVLLGHPK